DAKWGMRGVRSSNRHFMAPPQAGMKYNHCCVNNIPRGLLNMIQASVMNDGRSIYVNLFTDSETEVTLQNRRKVSVRIGGDYLKNGKVEIEAINTAEDEIILFLRKPGWSRSIRVVKDGKETVSGRITDKEGYIGVKLDPDSKSLINIIFDLNPRVTVFPVEPEKFDEDDWHCKRWMLLSNKGSSVQYKYMTWERKSFVQIGPLLLAQSKDIGSKPEDMFKSGSLCEDSNIGSTVTAEIREAAGGRYRFQCVYEVAITAPGGETSKILMCDYASACKANEPDECHFNAYI
ncbi:MAG: glycoside hydrolase family 127 protein, partial [Eubacteriales bacterium]|nr:glycoside hydrolase family 127 protein [Eubacteriales bacterium]